MRRYPPMLPPAAVAIACLSAIVSAQPAAPGRFLTEPLVKDIYTADPSAHVFNGRLFIYPSHDIEAGVPQDDLGSHFAMRDYHVFSMDPCRRPGDRPRRRARHQGRAVGRPADVGARRRREGRQVRTSTSR